MTRRSIQREIIARDLASRYGEGDTTVQSVRNASQVDSPMRPVAALPERRLLVQGPRGRKQAQKLQPHF